MSDVCECCGNDDAGYWVCTGCLDENCRHGNLREDVFLVAFTVYGSESRDDAQDLLMAQLKEGLSLGPGRRGPAAYIEEWWVAENDRRDGSDNDSAEFVPFQRTTKAVAE